METGEPDVIDGYCCSGANNPDGPIQNGDCPAAAILAQSLAGHTCMVSKEPGALFLSDEDK